MQLAVIAFALIAAGLVAYFYGAWKLSRFAARISGGLAAGVLLFPPVTYWFSFHKLKEEGKETPTSMWLFGLVLTTLIIVMFWTPLTYVFQGRIAELEPPVEEIKTIEEEPPAPVAAPTPAPAEVAPAAENNAAGSTNSAGTNNGTTTNSASTNSASTNNAAATDGAAEATE